MLLQISTRTDLLLACFVFCWPVLCDSRGYCSFPRFLWDPPTDGATSRLWLTKTEYLNNTDIWQKRKEILANETEIMFSHKIYASCNGQDRTVQTGAVPCFRQDIVHRIVCISEQPDDKFRVQQIINKKSLFSCMKFVQRSPGVVQVFQAAPIEVNEHRLCYDAALQRDEWPWIDQSRIVPKFCSFSGGFDFRGYYPDYANKKLCSDDWRMPRMEVECIKGDGINFFFPSNDCNPFMDKTTDQRLYCWGEWIEENYVFYLLAESDSPPKFVLRLSNVGLKSSSGQFLGFLYFSAVAPLSSHGMPPGKVLFIEMHMQRSESGICFDDTDECRTFASEGKCFVGDITTENRHANHCLKSCGMCEFAPTTRPECHFSSEQSGRWMLFDSDVGSTFDVNTGDIRTDSFGTFICKSKHWQLQMSNYKVLSIFNNGWLVIYHYISLVDISLVVFIVEADGFCGF